MNTCFYLDVNNCSIDLRLDSMFYEEQVVLIRLTCLSYLSTYVNTEFFTG